MSSRVLVVDDEPGLRSVLTDLFDMEGYDVVSCDGVSSAEKTLAAERFDAALVDVFLSSAPTGLGLAKHILSEYPGTGVIIMTGYADRADVESACISGAYTCIDKPFDLDDVLKVVRAVLDSNIPDGIAGGNV
jgi:DNA-binding NtrC family response regulator